MNIYYVICISI